SFCRLKVLVDLYLIHHHDLLLDSPIKSKLQAVLCYLQGLGCGLTDDEGEVELRGQSPAEDLHPRLGVHEDEVVLFRAGCQIVYQQSDHGYGSAQTSCAAKGY